MKVDGDFVATVVRQIFSDVTDQWLAENWNGGFGAVFS